MKKKYIILSAVIIILAIAGYFIFSGSSNGDTKFTFTKITKGDLNDIITSTGTLQADTTVEVGTQVSGIIAKIYVDYNSKVKKGQLLAVLDTTLLSAQVRDTKSTLQKSQAEFDQAKATYQRDDVLYKKGFLSELDYITAKTNLESATADLSSAESALERAKTNLSYAFITAPISGKIIDRNVEQGQTVAASFSTPTLFTIADDMSTMQILASVDESDIGQVKTGQKVDFTVEAYPEKKFYGVVWQVRLNPQTVQNVVNYTVVINADNHEGLLLPGMTATIDFYVEQYKNVMLVPNTALKFQPPTEMLTQFKNEMKKQFEKLPDSLRSRFMRRASSRGNGGNRSYGGGQFSSSQNNGTQNFGRIWYFDSNKRLRMSPVLLGFSDGKNTQIVRGRDVKDGMQIISGIEGENSSSTSENRNNFPHGFRRVF